MINGIRKWNVSIGTNSTMNFGRGDAQYITQYLTIPYTLMGLEDIHDK
jgi:hypothetical protein